MTGHARRNPSAAQSRRSGWVASPSSTRRPAGSHAARSPQEPFYPGSPGGAAGPSVVTIGQFFAVLKRRLPLLLVSVILGVVLAGVLLLNTPKTYQATAVVDISPTFGNGSSSSSSSSISTITESRIATSSSVALAAKQTLGFAGTPTDLASNVTVTSPLSSQVLNISFSASTARGAADGANAFANAYLDYRTATAQKELALRIARIQSQVADLQKKLVALKPAGTSKTSPQTDTQLSLLQNQIQDLQTQLNNYQTSVITAGQVAGAAAVPSGPSSPKSYLYLAGGLLLGLLVGIILAVVRDRKDDRVRGSADFEQSLGAPVIAEAVAVETGSKPGTVAVAALSAARGAEADAYRTVTTTVTSDSTGSRVVMLCGTGREGRSLAPLNLAATFAMQGLTTVIAGPAQAVEPATGLLQIDALPTVQGTRLADRLAPSRRVPGLFVLSLGDEVSLGATLRANGDNLDDVLAKVDIIVLDGINIELPSTSLRLGQIADEAVVVGYRNRTTHQDVERLARHLAQVRATVLGGVLLSRRTGLLRRRGRATGQPYPTDVREPTGSAAAGEGPSREGVGSAAGSRAAGADRPAGSASAKQQSDGHLQPEPAEARQTVRTSSSTGSTTGSTGRR